MPTACVIVSPSSLIWDSSVCPCPALARRRSPFFMRQPGRRASVALRPRGRGAFIAGVAIRLAAYAGTDTYSHETFNHQRVDWDKRSPHLVLGARTPFGQTRPDLTRFEIALEDHDSNALALQVSGSCQSPDAATDDDHVERMLLHQLLLSCSARLLLVLTDEPKQESPAPHRCLERCSQSRFASAELAC